VGLRLPPEWSFLTEKERLGPLRVLYVAVVMGVAYLAARRSRTALPRLAHAVLSPLELLGRRSLYAFLVHLLPALVASALHLTLSPRPVQELAALSAVAFVYAMSRWHVLGRLIAG
jgi:hypothetical protein